MSLHVLEGAAFEEVIDLWVHHGGASMSTVKDLWVIIPDPAIPEDPPLIWVRVFFSAPSELPVPSSINGGVDLLDNDALCVVDPYATTYPDYNLEMQLFTADGATLIASQVLAEGQNTYSFESLDAWSGQSVKFRARYGNGGKWGPYGVFSGNYVVGSS